MGWYSSEDIEMYKALIVAMEKHNKMLNRLVKQQSITIELLAEHNAALEDRLCELIIEKNMQKKRITSDVIVEIGGNKIGFCGEQQIGRRGGIFSQNPGDQFLSNQAGSRGIVTTK